MQLQSLHWQWKHGRLHSSRGTYASSKKRRGPDISLPHACIRWQLTNKIGCGCRLIAWTSRGFSWKWCRCWQIWTLQSQRALFHLTQDGSWMVCTRLLINPIYAPLIYEPHPLKFEFWWVLSPNKLNPSQLLPTLSIVKLVDNHIYMYGNLQFFMLKTSMATNLRTRKSLTISSR